MPRVYQARIPGNRYSVDPMSFVIRPPPRTPVRRQLMFSPRVPRPITPSALLMKRATNAATRIQQKQRGASAKRKTQSKRMIHEAKKTNNNNKLSRPVFSNLPGHLQNTIRVKSLKLPVDLEKQILNSLKR